MKQLYTLTELSCTKYDDIFWQNFSNNELIKPNLALLVLVEKAGYYIYYVIDLAKFVGLLLFNFDYES